MHPIAHNRPDITIFDHDKCKIQLVEISVPQDPNLLKATSKKMQKYQDLVVEYKQMYENYEIEVVPIIVGAQDNVLQSLRTNCAKIGTYGPPNQLQKIAVTGTCHILRQFLGIQTS